LFASFIFLIIYIKADAKSLSRKASFKVAYSSLNEAVLVIFISFDSLFIFEFYK